MIAYIEGKLLEQTETAALVLTQGGVGYEVFIPTRMLAQLPKLGETCCFYTATIVREDALELFGFKTFAERTAFYMLISINKVGPRTGLAILSHFTIDDLWNIVAVDDMLGLTQVPGIGKKTAEHVFLELKYKLKNIAAPTANAKGMTTVQSTVFKDSILALENLGYSDAEIRPVLSTVLANNPDFDTSAALRATLKALAGNK